MFAHLQKLSTGYYHRTETGDVMTRFSSDLVWVENATARGVPLGTYYALLIVALLLNIGDGTSGLGQVAPDLVKAFGGMRRIDDFLAEEPDVVEGEGAAELPRLSDEIRLEDVTFSYTGGEPNLREVTLAFQKGEAVAFVGASGSGKSTILNLITRSYDPGKGRVLFDDTALDQATEDSIRSQIGVVFQDTYLFNTTVRENVRQGRLDATDAEVEAAARLAELHDIVRSLPQGYDTPVGEGGRMLSGGQRPRVALARAMIRRPEILVLDEATSALDPGTEAAINATIRKLAQTCTVVSVTHRLASVVHVDRVFVMDQGRLVEEGSHRELLARDGKYRELWDKQSGLELSEDGQEAAIDADRLTAIPLLAELGQERLVRLSEQFVTATFDEGDDIVVQGAAGKKFYIIVRGSVGVVTSDRPGEERELAVLEIGDYFGEISLLADVLTTATVRARTPAVCLALTRNRFLALLADAPELREAIERTMAERRQEIDGGRQAGT